jgi:hypothetical protein
MIIVRRMLLGFLLLALTMGAGAQGPGNDPAALQILDHMSAVIGELRSCSFTLNVSRDTNDPDLGLVTQSGVNEVYMLGPNKMLVNSRSDGDHRGYWYDGKTVTYYSYDENNYAAVTAPATILQTIDAISRDYGVDFPAADFFYPTFTDDLIDNSDRIVFLGKKYLEGKDCFHILATGKTMGVQLWIADDSLNLPVKVSIVYYDQKNAPRYEATFSNWQINPELPAAIFDFVPPQTAARITLVPKTGK